MNTWQRHSVRDRRWAVGLAVGLVCLGAGLAIAARVRAERRRAAGHVHDYAGRRGLPLPPHEMRGAALVDFVMPSDMRTPKPLRAFETA